MPLFTTVSQVLPELKQLELNAKENADLWKNWEETEEFKEVYRRKPPDERQKPVQKEMDRRNSLVDDE